jgi:murein DD-endopeptidase MepM/ murein hydrolase activator NlpD
MSMIDLETLKKEVYQKEKRKLYKLIITVNLVLVFIVSVSLSSVKVTEREKELIGLIKETSYERDSLKNLLTNELVTMKQNENKLIRKSLSMSMDTSYIDSSFNTSDIYEFTKNQSSNYTSIEKVINSRWDSVTRIPDGMPITLADLNDYTDGFGYRKHPIYHKLLFHEGIDISSDMGADVFVTGDGTVEKVIISNKGYGNRIVVNHSNGYKTVYAHLSKINVIVGQKVKKHNVIGKVGNTGSTTGPHLHYEILIRNRPIDPYKIMNTGGFYAKK